MINLAPPTSNSVHGGEKCLKYNNFKVIPLFCTAHPLLRITLRHPTWRRFFLPARKEPTRATFAELKLLFAIIMPQIGWQLPGLPLKNKKMKKMCVIPKSAAVFHFENKLDLECYTISFILNLVPVPAAQIVYPGQCPPFTAVCEETSTVTPDFVF